VSSKVQSEFVPKIAVWLKERDEEKNERKAQKPPTKKSTTHKATVKKVGAKAPSAARKAKK
jgi:hypothetical protein